MNIESILKDVDSDKVTRKKVGAPLMNAMSMCTIPLRPACQCAFDVI